MPLHSLNSPDNQEPIRPSRKKNFKRWANMLEKNSPGGLGRAEVWIKQYVDRAGVSESVQCDKMAGADWNDKPPLQAIYDALKSDDENSPRFFIGLILWKVLAEHSDKWVFYRPEMDNSDGDLHIHGLVYWRDKKC